MMDKLTGELKEQAAKLGFVLSGVTAAATPGRIESFQRWLDSDFHGQMHYLETRREAYRHPRNILDGCRTILMLAVPYQSAAATPDEVQLMPASVANSRESTSNHSAAKKFPGEDGGRVLGKVARYAQSEEDYHDVIHRRLKSLKQWLLKRCPEARVRGVVDTAPLLEREFAEMAGLGWVGKNTLLLNRQWGSYFFLAALLTDLPLVVDEATQSGHCGTCTACLDACPTRAFPQPYILDARKCISYLTIENRDEIPDAFSEQLDGWIFGCDVCQEVCPWNRRPNPSDPQLDAKTSSLDVLEVLKLDDEAFRMQYKKTAFWRPRRRGLVRNAILIAGSQRVSDAVPSLIGLLTDSEATLRIAAAWALSKIRPDNWRQILDKAQHSEPDFDVRLAIQKHLSK